MIIKKASLKQTIVLIGRAVYVWIRNNRSPVQTMNARVVSKRMKVSGHGMHTAGYNASMRAMGSPTYIPGTLPPLKWIMAGGWS